MPLDDLTFQLDDGVILNSDATTPFIDIDKVSGLDSPEFRSSSRDHEGVDGGFIDAEFEKARTISLEGTIYDDTATIETLLDNLKDNYAPRTIPIPFYFKTPGVNERVVFVKPLGVKYNWESERRYGSVAFRIELYAEDPRIYEATEEVVTIDQGAITYTGIDFPLDFPFSFGGVSSTDDGQNVTNNGNRSTPAVIEIQGPVTNPSIINETEGLTLAFDIILAADETLVVDLAHHTVKLDGYINRRGTLRSPDWFLLQPGDTFIRYRAESAPPSSMTLTFRSAWR